MSGQGPRVAANDITVRYGSTVALRDVTMQVFDGEAVAIVGPSGSGKSTLLHALTGVVTPQKGSVQLRTPDGSYDVAQLRGDALADLRLRYFGLVFQGDLLIPELTVSENIIMPLLVSGVSLDEARARAADHMPRFGLAGFADRRIGQLSGGQAQRVSVARATVTRAHVIAADEPTGSLDRRNSDMVMDLLLAEVDRQAGRSLLVVTHDEATAARCTRVVRLVDGSVWGEA